MIKKSAISCALLTLLSCSACTHQWARNPAFVNPASYLGREVQVCGPVDGPNILETADHRRWSQTGGISIIERGPLDQRFRGHACVIGTLEYMGCQTEICTGAAFDYAIRIRRVVTAEANRSTRF
jgi:hypothetical protein